MKSLKLSVSVLAAMLMAVLFVMFGQDDVLTAKAAVSGSAIDGLSGKPKVLYEDEVIQINSSKPIYYAILKKETDTGAKVADFIEASYDRLGMLYYIDISNLSASKDCYVGLATNLTPGADGLVPVASVKVSANDKKINFLLNWGVEGEEFANGDEIIQCVEITNQSGVLTRYAHVAVTEGNTTILNNRKLQIQWRKGANCDWKDIDDLKYYTWENMKNSGAVVYFRLDAINDTDEEDGRRYSKENKIKLTITKAPTVKIDVSKLTLAVKNGTQFRVKGQEKWYTILPYNTNSTNTKLMREKNAVGLFDPYTESTKNKASTISIEEIKDTVGFVPVSTGSSLTLEIRTAATTKRPASRITEIEIPMQGSAPTLSGVTKKATSSGFNYAVGTIAATDTLLQNPAYEYAIVYKADYVSGTVDMSSLKWATANSGKTEIKDSTQSTYYLIDGTRKNGLRADSGDALLLIRRKGKTASKQNPLVLASQCVTFELSTAK